MNTKLMYAIPVGSDFVTWLIKEIDSRGWTDSELSRRANISHSMISLVLSQQKRPGLQFCVGVARALDRLPEDVMRIAGLLPPLPRAVAEEREAIVLLRSLPASTRHLALITLRVWAGMRIPLTTAPLPVPTVDDDDDLWLQQFVDELPRFNRAQLILLYTEIARLTNIPSVTPAEDIGAEHDEAARTDAARTEDDAVTVNETTTY